MVKPNFLLKPTFENVKSAHASTEMDVFKSSMKSSLHMVHFCARFNKFGMKSIFNAAF